MTQSNTVHIPMRPAERRAVALFRGLFRILASLAPKWGGKIACRLFLSPKRYTPPKFEQTIKAEGMSIGLSHHIWQLEGHLWGEDGPTVLLVHGWEGRGAQLGHFVRPLVAAGYRVLAFDGPAHGKSTGKQVDGSEYADALLAYQERFGPFEAVICHSFGGAAAQIALQRGFRPNRMVLIGVPDRLSRVLDRFKTILQLPEIIYRHALEHLGQRFSGDPSDVVFTGDRGTYHPPTLLIHDTEDREVPYSEGHILFESLQDGTHLATTGLGHRRILKDPAVVKATVNFVQGHGAVVED